MCEFCNGRVALVSDENIVVQVDPDTPIGVRRADGGSLSVLCKSKLLSTKIYYCPICGRKLNQEKRGI